MWFEQVAARGAHAARPGLGCLPLSGVYGRVEARAGVRLVHCALDLGVSVLDVADFTPHGGGRRLVAAALRRGRRDQVRIAAHVGWDPRRTDPGAVARQAARLLRHSGFDYLDLCYLHPAADGTAVEDRLDALVPLVTTGRALSLGLYGATAGQLRRAHRVHPIAVLAVEYSVWHRSPEHETLPAARALGVGIAASRPLGRGFLAGRIATADQFTAHDPRRADPRLSAASLPEQRRRLRRMEQIAADLDMGTGRLALAWLLSRGPDVAVLPGSTDCVHVEMNMAAAGTSLGPETLRLLAEDFPIEPAEPQRPAGPDGAADGRPAP